MNQDHLSLTEAQEYTGKSRSSLRRFVESIVKADEHADRGLILPTVSEVVQLKVDRHPFSWKISKELLDREFMATNQSFNEGESNPSSAGLVTVLNKTIGMLEKELEEKNKQIAEFQERQREFNFLIKAQFENTAIDGTKADESKPQKRRSLWKILTTPI